MSSTRPAGYAPPRSRAARSRRWLPSILLLAGTLACAEGSRSLYPAGSAGARGAMEIGGDRLVFVYARQGEYVLLGSRNRGSGGDILVHAPQVSAGAAGDASSATADFRCSSQRGRGAIAGRAQELAGPHSADGTSTVRDGFAPCWYVAPRSGLYGVRFTGATRGARGNDGSLAHPPVLAGFVSAWDVSVRSGAGSLADLDGRVFAHALSLDTGTGRGLHGSLHVVSTDGHRYRRTFRGDAEGRATFEANGADDSARHPVFFSDVAPDGPNATEVDRVLGALAIALQPAAPRLTSPTFAGDVGVGASTVAAGGTFAFTTAHAHSYEIVVSRDGMDFDPAARTNRVLTGVAVDGGQQVPWDGRDNAGRAFPAGRHAYRVVARGGEMRIPAIGVAAAPDAGVILTRLDDAPEPRAFSGGDSAAIDERDAGIEGGERPAPEESDAFVEPLAVVAPFRGVDVGTTAALAPSVRDGVGSGGFAFRNSGDAPASGVAYRARIGDPLRPGTCPDAVDFTRLPPGVAAAYQPAPACAIRFDGMPHTLGPGATLSFGLRFVVAATNAGPISLSTAVAASNEAPQAPAPNTAQARSAVAAPQVSVAASPMPGVASPVNTGDTIGYALGVTIANAPLAAPLVLDDTLGSGLGFGGVIDAGAFDCGGALRCMLPAGTAPGSYTLTYAATVQPSAQVRVANNVVASGGGGTLTCDPCSVAHALPAPLVEVSVSSEPPSGTDVAAGRVIVYTLTATVTGATLTSPLTLSEASGAGLDFGGVIDAGDFRCGGRLDCALPAGTAPGAYSLTYAATVAADAGNAVASRVDADGGGPAEPDCARCVARHPLHETVTRTGRRIHRAASAPAANAPQPVPGGGRWALLLLAGALVAAAAQRRARR